MRDHGGNIDRAKALWGGEDWIDLSTGINRQPWPVPDLPPNVWTDLPTQAAKSALVAAAQEAFATRAPVVALAGAQQAIQLIPRLVPPGRARILAPTYNEHAAALRSAGWQVDEVSRLADLAGAELAIVVNPNNPDGTHHPAQALRALAPDVGRLVVDESFADPVPELSVAGAAGERLIVLRSFGKFWGLAGLRLGFAFADAATVAQLSEMAGPWPVAGPALEIGRRALADRDWHAATVARLSAETERLDALATRAGWEVIGGTHLFRSYETPDAIAVRDRLARARIWSRIFPWSPTWLRLGLPGSEGEWARLEAALA
ncbi:MAG: threonine-phosphate decarboxylase [Rhodobacteraceae bacterium]|uniref:threonine-phosphate decarboxylase n=1 Tax=Thioclava marina TaxID=1915077 RepID=A0ABX3MN82_9RHOB|nr:MULTISPECIES: threonine-phosphate decarboxylase CobD [Thioclava]OOY12996.1 threonine-phosphate decarboxylase [Thioclava marina]OOY28222.1 threonine-phosphate decarboxylase [Thioclava sp. L04-15]TNE93805.1 MAG: threonine-phosphate decarboxylase [Paracoccaceae bacterium]TNF10573.1 MAG: threonine-phosphate decarboxylase [Paracoccaceae bacterium]